MRILHRGALAHGQRRTRIQQYIPPRLLGATSPLDGRGCYEYGNPLGATRHGRVESGRHVSFDT